MSRRAPEVVCQAFSASVCFGALGTGGQEPQSGALELASEALDYQAAVVLFGDMDAHFPKLIQPRANRVFHVFFMKAQSTPNVSLPIQFMPKDDPMRCAAFFAMIPLAACTTAGGSHDTISSVECGMNGSITTTCPVSVRPDPMGNDNWFVMITRPNGLPRAIYFSENEAWGAGGAQSDGSAAFQFNSQKEGSRSIISFGSERYIIPDSVIPGY